MNVCAGIVSYNPEVDKIVKNIEAIKNQVDFIVVVDNNSTNITEIEAILAKYDNVYLKKNEKNLGIGSALNDIFKYANDKNCPWVLTLDQDSMCKHDLVQKYINIAQNDIGQISCNILDNNLKKELYNNDSTAEIVEIDSCITSGSFNNVKAVLLVGGCNEEMFIDGIDLDLSYRLRTNGYKVVRLNYVGLTHELGDSKEITFLGKKLILTQHSPLRNYYARRNMIYLARKYGKGYQKFKLILRQLVYAFGTVILEDQKYKRLIYNVKGIVKGLFSKIY